MLKSKMFKVNLNNKAENIKMFFLLQVFVIMAAMTYFSSSKLNIIDERLHPLLGDAVLMSLVVLSGIVGIGSIFLFNELVKLIKKENEYELRKIEILQMEETNNLLRSQKHDFSNNLQVIWGMLSLGNLEKANEYLQNYTNVLKIDEEELEEIRAINNEYLYTLFLNKSYKCKDMEIYIHYNVEQGISLNNFNPIDLIRVFGNLLDNAIYAVRGLDKEFREIFVDIYSDVDHYFFNVSNKGPKIPEEIKSKIFNQGFTTKGEEGSGMGLYNVNQLVNKYRGTISVENNEYLGTQFIICIPKF